MALILPYEDKVPQIGKNVFLAPNATIIGDVVIEDEASVWFGAVLRGDVGQIRIGKRSNIQDLACVHMSLDLSHALIGPDVTVGHGAILHGCIVGDRCLIGMGSIVMDNAQIGAGSVVAAGTTVVPRLVVPEGQLVRGSPGRIVRAVDEKEARYGIDGADHYVERARVYRAMLGAQGGSGGAS